MNRRKFLQGLLGTGLATGGMLLRSPFGFSTARAADGTTPTLVVIFQRGGCDGLNAVVIGTPPQWHALQLIAALKRGVDVYCEKPLSLTIQEGRQVCQVAKETGKVFQVGTQQRSEYEQIFLKAVAIADLVRISAQAEREGVGFYYVGIPPEHSETPVGAFQPPQMRRLFELGRALALEDEPWRSEPPEWLPSPPVFVPPMAEPPVWLPALAPPAKPGRPVPESRHIHHRRSAPHTSPWAGLPAEDEPVLPG